MRKLVFKSIVLSYYFISLTSGIHLPKLTSKSKDSNDDKNITTILHAKPNVLRHRPANIEKALYEQANKQINKLKERFVYLNQRFRKPYKGQQTRNQQIDVTKNLYPIQKNYTTAAPVRPTTLPPKSQTDMHNAQDGSNNIVPGTISRELEYIELLKPPLLGRTSKPYILKTTPKGRIDSKIQNKNKPNKPKFVFKPEQIFNDKNKLGLDHEENFHTFGELLNDLNYDFFKASESINGEMLMDQYLRELMEEQKTL